MPRVIWASARNPSPYRDAVYSCCLLGDVVYVVGLDESSGLGAQRYRIESRSASDGGVLNTWRDDKVHHFASLFDCISLKDKVYAVGATERFWSILVFDRELGLIQRKDFEKPRFIPYSMDTDGKLLYIAGVEIGENTTSIHVEAISPDDLSQVGVYISNPRGRGAGAYTILYDSETERLLVGGYDNIDGFRSFRTEMLSTELSLVAVIRPGIRGAVTSLSGRLRDTIYIGGKAGIARVNVDGTVLSTNIHATGTKILYSTQPPVEGRVVVVTDNNLYVLDEGLTQLDTIRLARGTEVLAATIGKMVADTRAVYIAMTQMLTDVDWGWSILAVDPRPRRFRFFGR
ncbi:MAG: hypothetical protein JHC33_08320 [Ignisphaera sp.]|nr:hypothetical protein [Ignisphaera sp.]